MNRTDILWTSLEATVITGGHSTREWKATGIALNALDIRPGDLFFATDGEDLNTVFQKGAAAAVVPRNAPDHADLPLLRVGDPFDALLSLARAARFRTHAYVIAAQGAEMRRVVAAMTGAAFDVHISGRHVSQGLASMPEHVEFGIFGFSPQARPDIAIVSGGVSFDESVFASMPPSGRVLINADDTHAPHAIASARAAGVRNIFTYGRAHDCDAALLDSLEAANGTRVRMKILGENIEAVLPPGKSAGIEFLAGALILRLWDASPEKISNILASDGSNKAAALSNSPIALMGTDISRPAQTAFRVTNMIGMGRTARTAVLENIALSGDTLKIKAARDLKIPTKLDSLRLMYASSGLFLMNDAERAIREQRPKLRLESISIDALVPGDFMVFRGVAEGSKNLIASAMRMINPDKKAGHAV
jgi:hypothetical protein